MPPSAVATCPQLDDDDQELAHPCTSETNDDYADPSEDGHLLSDPGPQRIIQRRATTSSIRFVPAADSTAAADSASSGRTHAKHRPPTRSASINSSDHPVRRLRGLRRRQLPSRSFSHDGGRVNVNQDMVPLAVPPGHRVSISSGQSADTNVNTGIASAAAGERRPRWGLRREKTPPTMPRPIVAVGDHELLPAMEKDSRNSNSNHLTEPEGLAGDQRLRRRSSSGTHSAVSDSSHSESLLRVGLRSGSCHSTGAASSASSSSYYTSNSLATGSYSHVGGVDSIGIQKRCSGRGLRGKAPPARRSDSHPPNHVVLEGLEKLQHPSDDDGAGDWLGQTTSQGSFYTSCEDDWHNARGGENNKTNFHNSTDSLDLEWALDESRKELEELERSQRHSSQQEEEDLRLALHISRADSMGSNHNNSRTSNRFQHSCDDGGHQHQPHQQRTTDEEEERLLRAEEEALRMALDLSRNDILSTPATLVEDDDDVNKLTSSAALLSDGGMEDEAMRLALDLSQHGKSGNAVSRANTERQNHHHNQVADKDDGEDVDLGYILSQSVLEHKRQEEELRAREEEDLMMALQLSTRWT